MSMSFQTCILSSTKQKRIVKVDTVNTLWTLILNVKFKQPHQTDFAVNLTGCFVQLEGRFDPKIESRAEGQSSLDYQTYGKPFIIPDLISTSSTRWILHLAQALC